MATTTTKSHHRLHTYIHTSATSTCSGCVWNSRVLMIPVL